MNLDLVFQYYGIDWLGMVASLVALWLLGDRHRLGFLVGAFASLCWVAFGLIVGSVPAVLANFIFVFVHVRGWYKWKRSKLI